MKPTIAFVLAGLAALGCAASPDPVGQVEEGKARVRAAGDSAWLEAEIGSVLCEGDELETRAGQGVTFRVDGAWGGMIENGSLDLGGLADDGARRITVRQGDLFFLAEPDRASGFRLLTGAGMILARRCALILRTDLQPGVGDAERAAGLAPPARVQVVVISGEAVIENLGRARTVARGERGFLLTGRAPEEPRPIGDDVVADYEYALGQVLRQTSLARWARPPLFEPPAFPEPESRPEPEAPPEPAASPAPAPAAEPAAPPAEEKPPGEKPGDAPAEK
ncbi:MAG: hypothetical protein MUC63_05610 [Planctomycetes bacterium]|jgi:hypothetical protein|nr:hypothetical protein [Planctomycetota bacterium]